MILWYSVEGGSNKLSESSLRSAINDSAGKYWQNGVREISVTLPYSTVTVTPTPANAAVLIHDSAGRVIAPSNDGIYKLVQNETYTCSATASGYLGGTTTFTPDADTESVAISLTQSGGGTGGNVGTSYTITGYSGANGTVTANKTTARAGETVTLTVTPTPGYGLASLNVPGAAAAPAVSSNVSTYTFTMPSGNTTVIASFDEIVLTLNSQRSGFAPVKAAVFTKAELEALAQSNSDGWAYLYARENIWNAIAATKLVSLTDLFNAGGIGSYWRSGSYLFFTCSDGVYDKSYPDYNDISKCAYYMDGIKQEAVPAGLALSWASGSLGDRSVSDIAKGAFDSGSLRFVYGVSEETFSNKSAAGARSPHGVLEITLVYAASVIPTGTVGTSHDSDNTDDDDSDSGTDTPAGEVASDVTEQKDADSNVTVSSVVTAEAMEDALKSLPEDSALEINVTSADGSAAAVEVVLPVAGLKAAPGMSEAQKEAAGDNTIISLEATNDDGESVASFGGGFAVISIAYKTASGDMVTKVFRINEDGSLTDMNASYSDGMVNWNTSKFSFYMIEEVSAQKPMEFTDVTETDWFYDAVAFVYGRELFTGVSETEFAPNAPMTRAMLVTVLYRVENSPQVSGVSLFTDVSEASEYYYNSVIWASASGIAGGYSSDYFGAGDETTREQLVTILYRYAQYKQYDVSKTGDFSNFADKDTVSDWAQSAMSWAVAEGIIQGSGGNLVPQDSASRAQVAVILQRFLEKYE